MRSLLPTRRPPAQDILLAFCLAAMVSLPSIKLLVSSSLLNFAVLGALALVYVSLIGPQTRTVLFSLLLFYFFVILLQMWHGLIYMELDELAKYLFLMVALFLGYSSANDRIIWHFGAFLMAWGLFIALWQLTFKVPTDPEQGQQYLTVSMPLGVGVIASLGFALGGVRKLGPRLLLWLVVLIQFAALTTLLSRSGLLYPLVIFLAFLTYRIALSPKMSFGTKALIAVSVLVVFGLAAVVVLNTGQFRQLYRISDLLNHTDNEPRLVIYAKAIRLILESPWIGYGLGCSNDFFGNYPHNIFLELLVNGGVVLMVPFLLIVVLFFLRLHRVFVFHPQNGAYFACGGAACFLFLQWNTSFDLTVSYIPLLPMILLIQGAGRKEKESSHG